MHERDVPEIVETPDISVWAAPEGTADYQAEGMATYQPEDTAAYETVPYEPSESERADSAAR